MVETDQFRYELNSYDEPLKELRSALDLDNKGEENRRIRNAYGRPGLLE